MKVYFALTLRASAENSLTGPKVCDSSTTSGANINVDKTQIPSRNDEKSKGAFAGTAQQNEEQTKVKQPTGDVNGVVQQGCAGEVTPDQKPHDDGKGTPLVGDENRGDAARGSTQESTQRDENSIDASSRPNPDNKAPIQPPVKTTDGAHINGDPGLLGDNAAGNVPSIERKEQSEFKFNDGSSVKHPLNDGNGSAIDAGKTSSEKSKTTSKNGAPKTVENKSNTTQEALHHRNDAEGQNCVTVIFHALLTPTFMVNLNQGNKVFLRGDQPFSWKAGKQLQMRVVRLVCISFNVLIIFHSLLRRLFSFACFFFVFRLPKQYDTSNVLLSNLILERFQMVIICWKVKPS